MSDAENPEMQDHWEQTAEEIEAAVQAVKEESAKAQETLSSRSSELIGLLSQVTYKTCYVISYGLVFPSAWIAHAVSKDNALVHGLIDGARAAKDKAVELTDREPAVAM